MRTLRNWKIWAPMIVAAACTAALWLWSAWPVGPTSFDSGANGLWLGHKWYSGREVRTDEPIELRAVEPLVERLREAKVRFLFVHVGPALADGSIEDSASELFAKLREGYPEGVFLAWLGARMDKIDLASDSWRSEIAALNERLRAEGFDGVHFNLEPIRDAQPGYLELLAAVRSRLGEDWIISQATPRSSVLGVPLGFLAWGSWSSGFYRATMDLANQTVLMAYDTGLRYQPLYVAYVRDQTRRLVDWACAARNHEVLIGIPAYQDEPGDPASGVETIRNAAHGVRSALASFPQPPACFRGVAIYSHWVTDESEWLDYARHWLDPSHGAP